MVKPNLGGGDAKLSSSNLQKIMKGSKTIYLSPSIDIKLKEVRL